MKIALVCARPVLSNPGMLSVDLAFDKIKSQLPNIQVDRFCSWRKESFLGSTNNVEYAALTDVNQLVDYDKIVFWGDFLQWIGYGPGHLSDAGTREYIATRKISAEQAKTEILNRWYSIYLLEDRPDLQKKAIIIGSTLCGLEATQLHNQRYRAALVSLFSNASEVLMRDQLSAFYVTQLTGRENTYGSDCAFLLDINATLLSTTKYIAIAFGRCQYGAELTSFSHQVGALYNAEVINLNWLSNNLTVDELVSKVSIIKGATAVITDIYHCAVTTLRENVPVVVVGRGADSPSRGTLTDKKKEILCNQFFLSDSYMYVESVIADAEHKYTNVARAAVSKIRNAQRTSVAQTLIQKQKNTMMTRIIEALCGK